ncbi:MAG: Flp pilus assembly complex ATPase component TadA [Kiritimatiellae bacterium]|nr:Flp pilus assembly complex ATPase component TadA [Kiritimatiellia bacterium]
MWLTATSESGEVFPFEAPGEGEEKVVGRRADADIVLPNGSVSRRHARILCAGGRYFVEDLGSSLGTFLNRQRVEVMSPLEPSDTLLIAPYTLRLCETPPGRDGGFPPAGPAAPGRTERPEAPPRRAEPRERDRPVPAANNFLEAFRDANLLYTPETMLLKQRLHGLILTKLNLSDEALAAEADDSMREKLEVCLDETLQQQRHELPGDIEYGKFRQALLDELIGYGPITPLLRAKDITEIMVNGPDRVFLESKGRLYETGVRFFNDRHLQQIIHRIVDPLGRHIDEACPLADARLPDGSRVNAVIPPLALDGSSLTIRKFSDKKLETSDLISFGSMTREMALFLEEAVRSRQNIVVSGGTGSGKTTLLNVLSQFIPEGERVVTVEDSAELKLSHRNLVRLEARPANIEGKGRVSIRDLVINTLRMRPDRIIVGECRGAEALDMLQAMNTGHDGSLTTCHANSPRDALSRLENMVMMAGYELPSSAIREQVSSAVDLIVQQNRMLDGTRKVVAITEVTGREGDTITMQDIFKFEQEKIDENGRVVGRHTATGNIPCFVERLREAGGLKLDMGVFVPGS